MALSRNLILERVWGWDYDGGPRTADVHVRWLREKTEAESAESRGSTFLFSLSAVPERPETLLAESVEHGYNT